MGIKLDIASGQNKQEGFIGLDIAQIEGVDIVHDLRTYPWPLDTSSVAEVHCSHYVEHIPLDLPSGEDGMFAFMNELWRVCEPLARIHIYHPYMMSKRAFQDPTHRRFIPEATWHYFSRAWREDPGIRLGHYPLVCDFEVLAIYMMYSPQSDLSKRAQEYVEFAVVHHMNEVDDLHVELRCLKPREGE